MYERFTPRSRQVMQRANQAAQRLGQEYIAPEHVLLGILQESECVASQILIRLGVDLRKLRLEIERLLEPAAGQPPLGSLPQTATAKRVIERAIEESRALGHDYVGSEHMLLGLLDEQAGVAGQALRNLRVTAADVRLEIPEVLSRGPAAHNRLSPRG